MYHSFLVPLNPTTWHSASGNRKIPSAMFQMCPQYWWIMEESFLKSHPNCHTKLSRIEGRADLMPFSRICIPSGCLALNRCRYSLGAIDRPNHLYFWKRNENMQSSWIIMNSESSVMNHPTFLELRSLSLCVSQHQPFWLLKLSTKVVPKSHVSLIENTCKACQSHLPGYFAPKKHKLHSEFNHKPPPTSCKNRGVLFFFLPLLGGSSEFITKWNH